MVFDESDMVLMEVHDGGGDVVAVMVTRVYAMFDWMTMNLYVMMMFGFVDNEND